MAKEMIISVNGREKKIAIIENDQVTEFYIERGEDPTNQGIVGNIYKGRVMRVLPGMQSAFVDIGLERDAFLYVSDFFDEEEEFERIVLDKSKKSDPVEATRAAVEQIEKSRLEREQRIEATQEKVEPLRDTLPFEDEIETETQDEPPPTRSDRAPQQPAQRAQQPNNRRNERGGQQKPKPPRAEREAPRPNNFAAADDAAYLGAVDAGGYEYDDTDYSEFERIVDEGEDNSDNGEMLKDAMVQERIVDTIRASEFDIEPPHDTSELPGNFSFERVSDSDDEEPAVTDALLTAETPVVASVTDFEDDYEPASASMSPAPVSFERVSDDEEAETNAAANAAGADDNGDKAASKAKKRQRGGARRGRKTSATDSDEAAVPDEETDATEAAQTESTPKKKRAGSSSKAKSKTDAAEEAGDETQPRKTTSRRSTKKSAATMTAEDDSEIVSEAAANNPDDTAAEAVEATPQADEFADAEARVETEGTGRGEFATRRGGRRRRTGGNERTGNDKEQSNDDAEKSGESTEIAKPVEAVAPDSNGGGESGGYGGGRRSSSSSGSGGNGGSSSSSGRRDRRDRTTMITDLLREGQEIIVQIAKEPIAKKGARITSHIALPGRFLVYMPTVEHVGVSRKIESDSERQRLRKLIQAIRNEEDVPSGGFIVRTAGVGITDEDLRQDARYLVRTWLDIRKGAEKSKPAKIVHRDLDLVQRILRDQLSSDFAAIRVDSEDEYQSIVEFINLIQPRMVNRVKLYTRETPILEAYGVQDEIDKAVKPRVWLKSGGYLVINQTEALVAIDVNTGKFVGRGGTRLEDTITKTNLEAVDEIVRQIRLRDLGGIIVLDLIDMEERRNRQRVMQVLQEALQYDKSPTKVLSFNDFGLVIMTRKRVKQSLERTLCSPCPHCQGAGLIKSAQTICYEILEQARRLARAMRDDEIKQTTLRVHPEVAKVLRSTENDVLTEIEDHLGAVDVTTDTQLHHEQFDFAFI